MNDYHKIYCKYDYLKLIEVIENKVKYKPEVILICKRLLDEKKVSEKKIKEHARIIVQTKFLDYFTQGKHWHNKSIDFESSFLSNKELKSCFNSAKSDYIARRNDATNLNY